MGGAERVLLHLGKSLPSRIVVGYLNRDFFSSNIDGMKITVLNRNFPLIGRNVLVVCFSFLGFHADSEFDGVRIFSGSYAPLAVLNNRQGRNVYYCHTPPRFLYDLRSYYLKRFGFFGRLFFRVFSAWFKPRYEKSIKNMDVVIANSNNVRKRLKTYLNIDSVVVYPPVRIVNFNWICQGEYYLSTARLEPLKRIDLIIDAFKMMPNKNLVVASSGSDENKLRNLAAGYSNIKFVGRVDDDQLADLIGRCLATIYIPIDEDFGISPVESMAAGKPVIGVAEGGLLETVIDGVTGFLLPAELCTSDLVNLLSSCDPEELFAMRPACENRAMLFSENLFSKAIENYL
jgi:glycosyltransferase involved in cell wall biosynthesis